MDVALFASMYGAAWVLGAERAVLQGSDPTLEVAIMGGSVAALAGLAACALFATDKLVGAALAMGGSAASVSDDHPGLRAAFGWATSLDAWTALAIGAALGAAAALAASVYGRRRRASSSSRRLASIAALAFNGVAVVGALVAWEASSS